MATGAQLLWECLQREGVDLVFVARPNDGFGLNGKYEDLVTRVRGQNVGIVKNLIATDEAD